MKIDGYTVTLDRWAEFPEALQYVRTFTGEYANILPEGTNYFRGEILFRGQSNAKWDLETTLDRSVSKPITWLQYVESAAACQFEIEAFTGKRFETLGHVDAIKRLRDDADPWIVPFPYLDLLVYLRHHGFASPLMDWTVSPYVAAFFALEENCSCDAAVVYAYIERPLGGKSLEKGPIIRSIGKHIRTHSRHFAQQSRYTLATELIKHGHRRIATHQEVLDLNKTDQDLLFKILIDRKFRQEALLSLAECNINYFTIYGSEESLARSLSMREFLLQRYI